MRSGGAAQARAISVSVSGGVAHDDSVSGSGSAAYDTRSGSDDGASKQLERDCCPCTTVNSGVTCERCRLATTQGRGDEAVLARASSVSGKGAT